VRHARKTKAVHAPAFPGYLFVALDLRHESDHGRRASGARSPRRRRDDH
jgi:hypothetical protein